MSGTSEQTASPEDRLIWFTKPEADVVDAALARLADDRDPLPEGVEQRLLFGAVAILEDRTAAVEDARTPATEKQIQRAADLLQVDSTRKYVTFGRAALNGVADSERSVSLPLEDARGMADVLNGRLSMSTVPRRGRGRPLRRAGVHGHRIVAARINAAVLASNGRWAPPLEGPSYDRQSFYEVLELLRRPLVLQGRLGRAVVRTAAEQLPPRAFQRRGDNAANPARKPGDTTSTGPAKR